jgi:cytochrome c-type biogenesis protein CcmH
MLWVVFALFTGLAVLSILWPLARRPRETPNVAYDVALYRAQIDEIARDGANTGTSAGEIEAAKAEAGRRLIAAADRAAERPAAQSRLALRVTASIALIVVPLLAWGLYGRLGHPDWPDEPLLARLNQPPERMDIAAAVAKVEAHLAQHPEDGRGYEVLVPIYIRLGRLEDAVRMATTALQKLGDSPQRFSILGEALVAEAHGDVTEAARQAFEKAVALDPARADALFYLGLGAVQKGDKATAKDFWEKLLAQAPRDAPWRADVAARVAALSDARAGVPEGGDAIAALPPAERQDAIRGMVARLAARLGENGQDLEGWLRLMRAYMVLQDVDKAREALSAARKNFDGDPAGRARLDALARELGLGT